MCHQNFPWKKKVLKRYAKEYLDPDKGRFDYTYGERLVNWTAQSLAEGGNAINQIEQIVIPQLQKNRQTRRAIATTLNPEKDIKIENTPCMILDQFIIRQEKLHVTTYFRSHDIFGAALANWFAITKLMEIVAKKLKIEVGSLTSISCSAHVYERDFKNAKKMLANVMERKTVSKNLAFVPDPEGFFIIETKGNKIEVRHYNKLGTLSNVIKGKKPEEIYKTIHSLGIVSRADHAAYLGTELQKAKESIKKGVKYIMDEELK